MLRNELATRTGRETPLNVGQVYTTLERLQSAGLVRQDRDTEDGLPRYVLTDLGRASAEAWLRAPAIDAAGPWESMRFQVLLARSLPGVASTELVQRYREFWQDRADAVGAGSGFGASEPASGPGGGAFVGTALTEAAHKILARAALDWLDRVAAASDVGEPLQMTRPPRGRPAGPARR